MEVRFYANFRALVGGKSVEVPLEAGARAADLLRALVMRYPALEAKLLAEGGAVRDHVRVFVNGHDLATLPGGTETVLSPGDAVDIFPPIGGG